MDIKMFAVFTDIWNECKEYATKWHVSPFRMFFDYLYANKRHGFVRSDYFRGGAWSLSNSARSNYFSYKRWLKVLKVFNTKESIALFDDKVATLKTFSKYLNHKWLYAPDSSFDDFKILVQACNRIIVKPTDARYGLGVHFLNKEDITESSFDILQRSNALLEECVVQHKKLAAINESSVNTLRTYTVVDSKGKARILKCVLRVGRKGNVVDNFHFGGVIYSVDVEYGFVEGYGIDKTGQKYSFHPDTDKLMVGLCIPNWAQFKEYVISLAEFYQDARYVGWDIAITPDGVDLIEGNADADHVLFEVIGSNRLFYNQIMQYR